MHDLAASKLVAGREKDLGFVAVLLRHGMVQPDELRERVGRLPLRTELRVPVEQRLERLLRAVS